MLWAGAWHFGSGALSAPSPPAACPLPPPLSPCSAGPSADDLSTVAYTYTSSVDLVGHPNAGLVGVLVVAAPGALDR